MADNACIRKVKEFLAAAVDSYMVESLVRMNSLEMQLVPMTAESFDNEVLGDALGTDDAGLVM